MDQPGPHAVPAFEDALSIEDLVHGAILTLSPTAISNRSSLAQVSSTPPCSIMPSIMEHGVLDSFIMSSLGEHNTLESFGLTSDPGHDLKTLLARLTCSQPDEPCLTLLPKLQPSVDGILATLSPTDAEVFRSALDGVTLISHTPPFAKRPPPLPIFPAPSVDVLLASSNASMRASNLPRMRDNPVFFFAYFSQPSHTPIPLFKPTAVDLLYAVRAALRLTQGELNDKIR